MRTKRSPGIGLVTLVLLLPARADGQDPERAAPERFDGSAVIRVDDNEYTIRIECDARARPELGFGTEPNRITRADTGGRSNMVSLRLRPWRDTGEVLVSLDGLLAWIPGPTSAAGVLALDLDMSPTSVVRDGVPTAVTYDLWHSGDRPPGKSGVEIVADCTRRDPAAPSYRKLPGGRPVTSSSDDGRFRHGRGLGARVRIRRDPRRKEIR